MPRTHAPLDAPREAFWHQKWSCVLCIGANVVDKELPLQLKCDLGQILSAKGPDGVGGGVAKGRCGEEQLEE